MISWLLLVLGSWIGIMQIDRERQAAQHARDDAEEASQRAEATRDEAEKMIDQIHDEMRGLQRLAPK